MRLPSKSPTLLSLLAIILTSTHPTTAKPYPHSTTSSTPNAPLLPRQCANPCGWAKQLCCSTSQICYTDTAGQAQCGNPGAQALAVAAPTAPTAVAAAATIPGNGQWQYYTTTYVRTDLTTITTVVSNWVAAPTIQTVVIPATTAAPAAVTATCNPALNQISCGSICCASNQFCAYAGQCQALGGSSVNGNGPSSYVVLVTPTPSASASPSAFVRPTSNGVQTVTSTGTATVTLPFQTPLGTDGAALTGMAATAANNGLSGGAIAGIVIGVLLGILLLLLLCACFCLKGVWDRLLGILGLRSRNRTTTTTYMEEHHSHHGGAAAAGGAGAGAGAGGRRWFGTRPGRVTTTGTATEKKGSGWKGALGVAGALGALAVILGLKRRGEREDKGSYGSRSRSSVSFEYTSASE